MKFQSHEILAHCMLYIFHIISIILSVKYLLWHLLHHLYLLIYNLIQYDFRVNNVIYFILIIACYIFNLGCSHDFHPLSALCLLLWECLNAHVWSENVSGYVCNHGSPSGERDTASPRGHYGERLQRDSCLKKHMKKHHPLAGDSPWRHYRRDHNIRTAGWIHHSLLRLKLASEAWPQSLGDAVSRSPLGEPWLHT